MSSETTYHVRIQGKVTGPYTLAYLKGQRDQRRLAKFHEISIDEGKSWAPASSFKEIFPPAPAVERVQGRTPEIDREKPTESDPAAAKPKWFYLNTQGVQQGPVRRAELLQLLESDALPGTTMVWQAEMTDWAPATSLPEFASALSVIAVEPPVQSTLAVIALISSLLCCSPVGIVVGILALREIYRSKGAVVGSVMAWIGIILGVVTILLSPIIGFIAVHLLNK